MTHELAWLVELGSNPPQWWTGKSPQLFTSNHLEAIRFTRFEDAERAIHYMVKEGTRDGCKSVQHSWSTVVADTPQEP